MTSTDPLSPPSLSDLPAASAEAAAAFLRSLANPNRMVILCLLTGGERSVGDLLSHLRISQTALSQHLARLRAEGIVDYRRDHRTLYYAIKNPLVARIVAVLHEAYCTKAA